MSLRSNLRRTMVVYRKELRETLRDRRTLAVMILLPLMLYPVMTVVVSEWLISHELERKARRSRVLMVGATGEADVLQKALLDPETQIDLVIEQGSSLTEEQLRTTALIEYDIVIEVPKGFADSFGSDGTAEIEVYYDATSDTSTLARERSDTALDALSDREVQRRLESRGLGESLIRPLSATATNVASPAEVGRNEIAKPLPFFIVIMTLLGSFYPAIDLTAGERERGTLEPLLATPMPRRALIAGKYLTVATISALTALLNILCMAAAALWIARSASRAASESGEGISIGAIAQHVPWGAVGLALVGLVGATLLFSGIMMAVASLARGFKEAQNLLTPMHMVLTVPAMATFLPGTELSYGTALIPVTNITLLLKGAIAGDLEWGPALTALLAIFAFAAAGMALAARIYDSERLLFAPDTPETSISLGQRVREMLWSRRRDLHARLLASEAGPLGVGEALVLYAVVAVLLFFVGAEMQQGGGPMGVAGSIWLLVALPAWIAARIHAGDSGNAAMTLGLVRPPGRAIFGAVLIGSGLWVVLATFILPIQERLFPMPEELSRKLQELAAPAGESLWLVLFATALTPAIAEELLCRGALTRSLRAVIGPAAAVVLSAALFGLLHLSMFRFLPTFLLGLMLGAVTVASRSVVPAMIIHFLNNAGIILVSRMPDAQAWWERSPWPIGFVALGVVLGGSALLFARTGGAGNAEYRIER